MRYRTKLALIAAAVVIALGGGGYAIAQTVPATAAVSPLTTTGTAAAITAPRTIPTATPGQATTTTAPAAHRAPATTTRKPAPQITQAPRKSRTTTSTAGCARRAMAAGKFNPSCPEYQGYLDPGTAGSRAPTSGELQQAYGCKMGYIPKGQC